MCNLEIRLRGLTTLVKINKHQWRVVLPNAMRPTVSRLDPSCIIEEHYPNIALPEDDIDAEAQRRANFKGRIHLEDVRHMQTDAMSCSDTLFDPHPFYDVFLTPYHEIQIHGITGPKLRVCDDYVADPSKPPTGKKLPLRYTADLRNIPKYPLPVKDDVFTDPPIDLVAAYLDLKKGEICAQTLIEQDMYTFINSGQAATPKQLLAFEISIMLELDDDAYIYLRDRRDPKELARQGCGPDNLTIELNTDHNITMVIDNAPLEDILAIRYQVGIEPSFSGEPFYHFEVIHNLLELDDPKKEILLPVAPEYNYAPHLCPPHTRCVPASTLGDSSDPAPQP